MSFKTETIINRLFTINHYEKSILSALATFSDSIHEKCCPSVASIAYRSGCSVRQTHNIIKRLVNRGLLFIIKSGKAARKPNIYQLNEKKLIELKNQCDPEHKAPYMGQVITHQADAKDLCTASTTLCTSGSETMHHVHTNKIINNINNTSSLQTNPEEEILINRSEKPKAKAKAKPKAPKPKTPKPKTPKPKTPKAKQPKVILTHDWRPTPQTAAFLKVLGLPINTREKFLEFQAVNMGRESANWDGMLIGYMRRGADMAMQQPAVVKHKLTYQQKQHEGQRQ